MDNQRFRDLPIDEVILPLQFVPDMVQLEAWLDALSALEPSQAAVKILQAIGAFEHGDIKPSLKIKLLLKIYEYLPSIVQTMQKSYIDSSLPLNHEAVEGVERVVWIYMQLARNLRQCKLKLLPLGKEQQAILLFLGLEALAHALLHISLSYKMPMYGFWALCYDLYVRAELANLTHIEITWQGRKRQNIAGIFKQLLIFYLCDTRQFRSRDMLTLFECLPTYSAEARILANYQPEWRQVVCVFNLNKDFPPQKITTNDRRDDLSERFITTVIVAKNMHQVLQQQVVGNNALRSINQEILARALNSLGLARKRKFTRILEDNEVDGLVGLKNLIDYLSVHSDLKAIMPVAPQAKAVSNKPKKNEATRFDLVPVGEELAYQLRDTVKQQMRRDQQFDKLFNYSDEKNKLAVHVDVPTVCQFEMRDSSVKGYGVVTKLSSAQVRVGDIVAIMAAKTGCVEVGLVRRINQMPKQYLHLGLEVLGFEAELVYVASVRPAQSGQGCLAILLPGIKSLKQADGLLFNSSLFLQGDEVEIRSKHGRQRFKLNRLIQMTLAATHMELLPLTDIKD